jgi:selenide,water dikinase
MPRNVILVGGGHSHVQVLESLAAQPLADARVTVVVDRPIAIYSGMVPGFVAGQYRASELEIDVPQLCQWAGVECIVEAVTQIDAGGRRLHLEGGSELSYELASINIGSTVAGLDLPGIRELAIPTRPIAELIRRTDDVIPSATQRDGSEVFRILVVGGGAGGIELAFTFQERLLSAGCRAVETRIINSGPRILAGYPAGLVRRTQRAAKRRGIEIHCNLRVQEARVGRVVLDDGNLWTCDAVLWVTGAVGHSLARDSGLPVGERGFIQTEETLQVLGHDGLFAVGDCGTLVDHPDTPKAGVYAVRQGPVLTRNLRAALAGRPLQRYRPQSDFLTLLNLGDGTAVGTKKGISFQGRWVMRLKDRIDRAFMRRFQVDSQ